MVVKAQVGVEGRGKAGGIKPADSPEEVYRVASEILGMRIKSLVVKKLALRRVLG